MDDDSFFWRFLVGIFLGLLLGIVLATPSTKKVEETVQHNTFERYVECEQGPFKDEANRPCKVSVKQID